MKEITCPKVQNPLRKEIKLGHQASPSAQHGLPTHFARVLRTRSASERPPAGGLHPLGPPPREVLDGGELQPAHIHSPAAFLPTLHHDGGWEPGIGGGSNHTVEAGKHCRSGLFFFFFFLESWLLTIQQHTTSPE